MPEQTEKLLHFTQAVLDSATRESETLRRQLAQDRAEALSDARAQAREASRAYFDREAARIRAEAGREVSLRLMENKRQVYLRRKEIGQEVFDRVRERIEAFTASPEYPERLRALLVRALGQLKGAEQVTVYLRREDMHYTEALERWVGPVAVTWEEGDFSLGGLTIRCPELGQRVDCSYDSQLAELSGHFAETFGLSLSDDDI